MTDRSDTDKTTATERFKDARTQEAAAWTHYESAPSDATLEAACAANYASVTALYALIKTVSKPVVSSTKEGGE